MEICWNSWLCGANNGRTSGTYAWIDFSSTDVGTILEVEDVETSLTTPTLEFDYFSDNGIYSLSSANTLYVEAYDGSSWIVIDSLQVLVLDEYIVLLNDT